MSDESNSVSDQSNSSGQTKNLVTKDMDWLEGVMRSINSDGATATAIAAVNNWCELDESEKLSEMALSELGLAVVDNIGNKPLTLCQAGVLLSLFKSLLKDKQEIMIQDEVESLVGYKLRNKWIVHEFRKLMDLMAFYRAVGKGLVPYCDWEVLTFAESELKTILQGTSSIRTEQQEDDYEQVWSQFRELLSRNNVAPDLFTLADQPCDQTVKRVREHCDFLKEFETALLFHVPYTAMKTVKHLVCRLTCIQIAQCLAIKQWLSLPPEHRLHRRVVSAICKQVMEGVATTPLTIRQAGLLALLSGKSLQDEKEVCVLDQHDYFQNFIWIGMMTIGNLRSFLCSVAILSTPNHEDTVDLAAAQLIFRYILQNKLPDGYTYHQLQASKSILKSNASQSYEIHNAIRFAIAPPIDLVEINHSMSINTPRGAQTLASMTI